MPSYTFDAPEGFDPSVFSRPKSDIFPVPSLDKEYVTNIEIVLNKVAKLFEETNPGKECIGFKSKMNDAGDGFLYMPVMIDKQ